MMISQSVAWQLQAVISLIQLWPLFGGTLTKPHRSKLFYVPQRPYMTLGTLRDQIIYPDTREQMLEKGYKDEDLEEYLKEVCEEIINFVSHTV